MNPEAEAGLDVLVDVDGVLYPLPEILTRIASHRFGRPLTLDTSDWAFYEKWGLDRVGFVDLVNVSVREGTLFWQGAPYPDVVKAWARLLEAGHRIHVVTARNLPGIEEIALAATRHWFEAWGLAFHSLHLAQDKPVVLERLGLEPSRCVAVDDAPQNVAAWEAVDVHAVVLDQWGTYRGDHRKVPNFLAFTAHVETLVAADSCR